MMKKLAANTTVVAVNVYISIGHLHLRNYPLHLGALLKSSYNDFHHLLLHLDAAFDCMVVH
jgi:hypothetical protein